MRKLAAALAGAALMVSMAAGSAMALPTLGGETPDLQTIFNEIGLGNYDVTSSYMADGSDKNWNITASGSSVATMIVEVAGLAASNIFGIYDASNPNTKLVLFYGPQGAIYNSGPNSIGLLSRTGNEFTARSFGTTTDSAAFFFNTVTFASSTFGYFIKTPTDTFYSDTALNSDNFDHMLAYRGDGTTATFGGHSGQFTPNEYILAWEDLPFGQSDTDYQDMVLMVESVAPPVPEPGTMMLLGIGMLGFAIYGKRRMNRDA